MADTESLKFADADSVYEALLLSIEAAPPCDLNRLSPRHALLPRKAVQAKRVSFALGSPEGA
ncbi:hypothetical protein IscW_ISCW019670 [Ixodes scapularis]|uniref:Uncharacterized protein n=1 Tax=Ixodes scapularis TaxID=6945 RepID=B7PW79_IXOSC|nr:hypothetical protein IscW_ISCW019670 [Ixodes scapularis]|eukprot:XP_002409397.1 hypothetical protein IscW_ISCW019670 [Ixodes scapularis]